MTHDEPARILLVDDEADYLEMVAVALRAQGFECALTHDGAQGLQMARQQPFDLVISDVNMPGCDGFMLCRELRAHDPSLPIILLTSRDSDIDEALGLDLGADDYIAKPVPNRLLIARVRALLRRARQTPSNDTPSRAAADLRAGALRLDAARMEARWRDQPIEAMTVTEFRLLRKLASAPGRVFTRDILLDAMRAEPDTFVSPRMVDAYVNRLRRKLEAAHAPSELIETVIGLGYRFRDLDR